MGRRPLLFLSLLACVLAVFPAAAHAARAKAASPVVKSVSPKKVRIGQTLTIRGKNFIRGTRKNSVVFSNSKRAAVFVRAGRSSTRRLKVKLPEKLTKLLLTKDGQWVGTRLRLRIISRRAGRSLSSARISPVVYPAPGKSGSGGPTPTGTGSTPPPCASDSDLLPDDVEIAIGTNRCVTDSDGDGMEDGWEYQSALDLNNGASSLPYPGKRPYPNPLDSDANADHDGDGLSGAQEHAAWAFTRIAHSLSNMTYSAGDQTSGNGVDRKDTALPSYQLNADGRTTDDERDADQDGLANWDEANGRMRHGWWLAVFKSEPAYGVAYAETDFLVADSDGDQTRLDGADDQDFDGFDNVSEVNRGPYWVQPFNPCLPDPDSVVCSLHPPVDSPWEPFKSGDTGERPLAWPRA